MDNLINDPIELASIVSKMEIHDLEIFLKELSKNLKEGESSIDSPLFIASSYLGISSNWLKQIK